ncbi:hypothetical protein C5E51_34500 [Nocardia nova]|uniref:hypothetical protein n=1 Tax=Nocardia nova TaxID=37330 RepID=UPI000CEA01A5|nr:hypothetical protein [Nocardia nova]PPJ01227.1 hypothetical protein C5E51_34500 [Nocardia nova]
MTALDELTTLLPPPAGAGRSFDWTAVEQQLGVTIPDDFKALLGVYGDVRFCNALRLYRPADDPWLDLAAVTLAARDPLADNEFGEPPADVPAGVSIDPATLIQWGGSFGGDYCLWDAHDPDPQKWTLVFTDIDKLDWGFYPGTVTEYLLDWLTGHAAPIPLWGLDAVLPDGGTPFAEIYDPTDFTGTITDRINATAH